MGKFLGHQTEMKTLLLHGQRSVSIRPDGRKFELAQMPGTLL